MKDSKFLNQLFKKLKAMSWPEVLGIVAFFSILLTAGLFLTRKGQDISVTVRLLNSNSQPYLYNFPRQMFSENIKKGLVAKSELGGTIAEVTDVYKYPSSDVNQDIFVKMKIKSVYNSRTGQYFYDDLPLFIGDYRTFKFQNITFSGLIIDINSTGSPASQKRFLISGFLDPLNNNNISVNQQATILNGVDIDGIKNFLADQIVPGLKIIDSENNVGAEIVSVKKSIGTIKSVQNGIYTTVNDPDTTHVEMTLNILADKVGDGYFFQKEQSFKIGSTIFLSFPNTKVILTVASVTDVN